MEEFQQHLVLSLPNKTGSSYLSTAPTDYKPLCTHKVLSAAIFHRLSVYFKINSEINKSICELVEQKYEIIKCLSLYLVNRCAFFYFCIQDGYPTPICWDEKRWTKYFNSPTAIFGCNLKQIRTITPITWSAYVIVPQGCRLI